MAATALGTVALWGINAVESGGGMIILDWRHKSTADKAYTRNRYGSAIGVTFFNERIEISVTGEVPTTSAFSGKIAATLALTNAAATTHLQTASGSTICHEVELTAKLDGFRGITLNAEYAAELAVA